MQASQSAGKGVSAVQVKGWREWRKDQGNQSAPWRQRIASRLADTRQRVGERGGVRALASPFAPAREPVQVDCMAAAQLVQSCSSFPGALVGE